MRKIFLIALCALALFAIPAFSQQNKCGMQAFTEALIAKDPQFAQKVEQLRQNQALTVAAYKLAKVQGAAAKTTGIGTIPVIFHIVLDSQYFNLMGGVSSIQDRADSQIAVINRDFNGQNADSTLIPGPFKPLYANVGISFGLAHRDPQGASSPGYEITITNATSFSDVYSAYSTAKHDSTGGANIWDPSRYLNVWVINPSGVSGLLGLTAPESYVGNTYPQNEEGVVLNFGAFGVYVNTNSGYFVNGATGGRTLTHELGHFFEIWHTWGDDNGACPPPGTGQDDGIADTPPQADASYGCNTFPKTDACSTTSPGIMFMNYMDYSDDDCVHLFTIDQAIVMSSKVQPDSESYSLTQNPDILTYPSSVSNIEKDNPLSIYPNPGTGIFRLSFGQAPRGLEAITVANVLGQEIQYINTSIQQSNMYTLNLSAMSKGIYFIQCHFAAGTISRKIILQ